MPREVKPKLVAKPTAREVLEAYFGEGLEFFSTDGFTQAQLKQYGLSAKAVLDTNVFRNEFNACIDSAMRSAALRSTSFEELEAKQKGILLVLSLLERFEELAGYSKEKPQESFDPASPI